MPLLLYKWPVYSLPELAIFNSIQMSVLPLKGISCNCVHIKCKLVQIKLNHLHNCPGFAWRPIVICHFSQIVQKIDVPHQTVQGGMQSSGRKLLINHHIVLKFLCPHIRLYTTLRKPGFFSSQSVPTLWQENDFGLTSRIISPTSKVHAPKYMTDLCINMPSLRVLKINEIVCQENTAEIRVHFPECSTCKYLPSRSQPRGDSAT